jgi:hypothetical protein
VFRRFIEVFARPEHPLALFLDDLQWLDGATLDLLEHLVTHSDVRHLLLVGAYRDNEVNPSHPLMRTLDAIRESGARVQDMMLSPLGLDDVGQLVADAMRCEPERVQPLAQLVQEKTGGNPFFAIQFFITLAEEKLLAFCRARQPNASGALEDFATVLSLTERKDISELEVVSSEFEIELRMWISKRACSRIRIGVAILPGQPARPRSARTHSPLCSFAPGANGPGSSAAYVARMSSPAPRTPVAWCKLANTIETMAST